MSLHHEHHKIPKALGGPDSEDNLVDLCQTDHQLLHTIAFMIVNPKRRHEIEPTLASIYPNDRATQKLIVEYANYAAREMALKKEIKKEDSEEMRTVVELPVKYMELLKLAGYDRPHKSGRPRGVGAQIRMLVAEHLAKKFPSQREQIIQLMPKKKSRE